MDVAAQTIRRFTPVHVRDVRRSLVGQSVLVATVCLVVDSVEWVVGGMHSTRDMLLLLMIILVDAALALPARFSGWVALAHGVSAALLGGTDAGLLIAGYRAGAWLRGWPAPASLVAISSGIVVARLSDVPIVRPAWLLDALQIASSAVLPWLVGRYTTARRAYIDELRHRREVEARDAATEVDRAVARERTAIARDLHDVISHHVSAIGVHAGAARMKLDAVQQSHAVVDSLAAVEAASRSAMIDLRTMLDLLHGAADTTNQPGLDNLEELLQNVRRSGIATRLHVRGVARPVPGSLDIALYRITQEMLTNAMRHGDGTHVDVEIDYRPTSITLTVRNGIGAGRGIPVEEDGTGRGLAGIRTRVAMFHGSVSYGPNQDTDRWETIVTVPTDEPIQEAS